MVEASAGAPKLTGRAFAPPEAAERGVGSSTQRPNDRIMLKHVLALLLPILGISATLTAQNQPPAVDSCNWQVHDQNGPIQYEIIVILAYTDALGIKYYVTGVKDQTNNEIVSNGYIVEFPGNTRVLSAYSGDSQMWMEWHWNVNHYDKVGGTAAIRSYYPMR
ncbi:MAG: hypothetical protein H6838_10485 [Planctomycetes bacterium]|nr:hypothetical protein [Planctomycetota bacterium]